MSLSIYQASAPVFIRQLRATAGILEKGEAFAKAKGIDPAEMLDARIAPDMHPLIAQVQIMSDLIKGTIARLAEIEQPSFPDTETTFAELQARIAKTIDFVASVPAEKLNGKEDIAITLHLPNNMTMLFTGVDYLNDCALPNIYFHATTIYALLRGKGVEIGKLDFLAGAKVVIS